MEEAKLKGIIKWPILTTLKQLRSFLGFCNFYHRFIKDYANHSKALNKLLKKTEMWNWTDEQQKAFDDLKNSFSTQPVLLIPNQDKPFFIMASV